MEPDSATPSCPMAKPQSKVVKKIASPRFLILVDLEFDQNEGRT